MSNDIEQAYTTLYHAEQKRSNAWEAIRKGSKLQLDALRVQYDAASEEYSRAYNAWEAAQSVVRSTAWYQAMQPDERE